MTAVVEVEPCAVLEVKRLAADNVGQPVPFALQRPVEHGVGLARKDDGAAVLSRDSVLGLRTHQEGLHRDCTPIRLATLRRSVTRLATLLRSVAKREGYCPPRCWFCSRYC